MSKNNSAAFQGNIPASVISLVKYLVTPEYVLGRTKLFLPSHPHPNGRVGNQCERGGPKKEMILHPKAKNCVHVHFFNALMIKVESFKSRISKCKDRKINTHLVNIQSFGDVP